MFSQGESGNGPRKYLCAQTWLAFGNVLWILLGVDVFGADFVLAKPTQKGLQHVFGMDTKIDPSDCPRWLDFIVI